MLRAALTGNVDERHLKLSDLLAQVGYEKRRAGDIDNDGGYEKLLEHGIDRFQLNPPF